MKNHPLWKRLKVYLRNPLFWMLVAFIVRFIYFISQSNHPLFNSLTLDGKEAYLVAQNLANGNGFDPSPFFKAPLYPLFLSFFINISSQWIWLAKWSQHLLGAVLVAICCDAARAVSHTKQRTIIVIITGLFLSFYGPLIRLENRIVLDFLFVFLQAVMLWALLRLITTDKLRRHLPWCLTAGIAAALSILTRPTLIPVLPPLAFLLAWIDHRF